MLQRFGFIKCPKLLKAGWVLRCHMTFSGKLHLFEDLVAIF